jgi:hypothetical protein
MSVATPVIEVVYVVIVERVADAVVVEGVIGFIPIVKIIVVEISVFEMGQIAESAVIVIAAAPVRMIAAVKSAAAEISSIGEITSVTEVATVKAGTAELAAAPAYSVESAAETAGASISKTATA